MSIPFASSRSLSLALSYGCAGGEPDILKLMKVSKALAARVHVIVHSICPYLSLYAPPPLPPHPPSLYPFLSLTHTHARALSLAFALCERVAVQVG